MGYEVEIKFRVADHDNVRRRLAALGTRAKGVVDQYDTYLAHPGRNFAETDEALRVRRDGLTNWITYKGPKKGGPTKTREEIDIRFAEGADQHQAMTRLFERLGFAPVLTLRKTRETHELGIQNRELLVVLDRSAELGEFAEVETLATSDDDLPAAQATVLAVAAELGLSDVEPRSYLRMALELRAELRPGERMTGNSATGSLGNLAGPT
jgi:adenylate cyclase class 2